VVVGEGETTAIGRDHLAARADHVRFVGHGYQRSSSLSS
jgi:hypothetical protein